MNNSLTVAEEDMDAQSRRSVDWLWVVLVLLVLGLVGGRLWMTWRDTMDLDPRTQRVRADLQTLKSAIARYVSMSEEWPKSLNDLIEPPSNKTSQLLKMKVLDPWLQEYRYEVPSKHGNQVFDVYSVGPDGVAGTEDDVGNWQSRKP